MERKLLPVQGMDSIYLPVQEALPVVMAHGGPHSDTVNRINLQTWMNTKVEYQLFTFKTFHACPYNYKYSLLSRHPVQYTLE